MKLARPPHRHLLAGLIQNVNLRVEDWPADRRQPIRRAVRKHRARRGDHRAFRRAVVVHQLKRQACTWITVQRVASGQHRAKRRLRGPRQCQQPFCHRCRRETDRDRFGHEPIAQPFRIADGLLFRNVQTRAGRQIRPHFPDGRVESHPRDLAGPIRGRHFERLLMPPHEIRVAFVGDLHALGSAGRA